ncbi:MAG: hypothetical protein PWP03_364 [Candidatus Woesearchaeota archaeon]|nr:hypothetical protein [Candidatus Woesearchaeota archaeon]MDN5327726.1 hypothetical protein [Candidatus Woesearchaeota archaeon]
MAKVVKDLPLSEITLRRYEKPERLSERNLIKRVCLSLGLLNPGDSRDIIVEILYVLTKSKKPLTLTQIEKKVYNTRKKFKQNLQGITPANISRQLRKLKKLGIVSESNREYSLSEGLSLTEIFDEKVKPLILQPILERISLYLKKADDLIRNKTSKK